jgi:hypothetical protein
MPFQSEKQRRYLWANEPEIARDWTDTYGSRVKKQLGGGIMDQIPFMTGFKLPDAWNQWQQHKLATNLMKEDPNTRDYHQMGGHDFMQRFPNTPDWLGKGLATGYQLASEFGKGILNPSRMSSFLPRALEEARLNRAGIEGLTPDQQTRYDSFSKTFDPTIESMYPTDKLASLKNIIGTEFGGSAQAGEPSLTVPDDFEPSAFQDDYNYRPSTMASNWSELDDVEAQNVDTQRRQQLSRLAGMEQYPTVEEEEDTEGRRNWWRNTGPVVRSAIANKFGKGWLGSAFAGPIGWGTSLTGGIGNFANTMRGGLTQRGWERARDQRRLDARRANILNRAAKGKAVGNVSELLGPNYEGTPGGGISFTGKHEGSSTAGAGYSRSDDSWSASPFRRGGLAALWPR